MKQKRLGLTTGDIKRLHQDYMKGETLQEIGDRLGITRQVVYYYFKRMNLPRRTYAETYTVRVKNLKRRVAKK